MLYSEMDVKATTEGIIKEYKGKAGICFISLKAPDKKVHELLLAAGWKMWGKWQGQYAAYNMVLYAYVLRPPVEDNLE